MPKQRLEKQIFDVHYQHLMEDPIQAVKEIYQHFGLQYTQPFEDNMRVCQSGCNTEQACRSG